VDRLRFLGMFVPNESTSYIVSLGKVIVVTVFHVHQQNHIRSVDISMSMTLFPTLKSGV